MCVVFLLCMLNLAFNSIQHIIAVLLKKDSFCVKNTDSD